MTLSPLVGYSPFPALMIFFWIPLSAVMNTSSISFKKTFLSVSFSSRVISSLKMVLGETLNLVGETLFGEADLDLSIISGNLSSSF